MSGGAAGAADVGQARATFPPPPPWYALFTEQSKRDALRAGVAIPTASAADIASARATAGSGSGGGSDATALAQAKQLWTPPQPPAGAFTKFGALQTGTYLKHELGPGVPKLFDDSQPINFSAELRRLNRLALVRYTEVLAALTGAPAPAPAAAAESGGSSAAAAGAASGAGSSSGSGSGSGSGNSALELIAGVEHALLNVTHLLNVLRPHQARQTLITVLDRQIRARHDSAAYLELCAAEAQALLASRGVTFDPNDTTSLLPPHLMPHAAAVDGAANGAAAAAAAPTLQALSAPPALPAAEAATGVGPKLAAAATAATAAGDSNVLKLRVPPKPKPAAAAAAVAGGGAADPTAQWGDAERALKRLLDGIALS